MPVQYEGIQAEHLAVRRRRRRVRRLAHGPGRGRGPRRGRAAAAAAVKRRAPSARGRRPVQRARASRTAACSTTCSPTGSADCHFLTVTNAANHERDLAWFAAHAEPLRRRRGRPARRTSRCSPSRAPRRAALLRELADGSLPSRLHCCERTLAGVPMLVCGTGYTGEDGAELLLDPGHAPAVWDALVEAGATPAGLGARDTLRLEVCLPPVRQRPERGPRARSRPASAGAARSRPASSAPTASRACEPRARLQKLVAFAIEGDGIARQGNPIAGGGVVTSGTFSPCLERGIGMAYVPARASAGRDRARDRRARAGRAQRSSYQSRSTRRSREQLGRSQLSRRSALSPRARLGAGRRRRGDVRDHVVRPGCAGRGCVLRPARRSAAG